MSYPADFSSSSIFKGFQKKLTQAFFSFVFWMVSHTGSPSLVHFTSTRRDCKCTTTSLPLHPSVTLNHQVTLVLMAWPSQSSDWMGGGGGVGWNNNTSVLPHHLHLGKGFLLFVYFLFLFPFFFCLKRSAYLSSWWSDNKMLDRIRLTIRLEQPKVPSHLSCSAPLMPLW